MGLLDDLKALLVKNETPADPPAPTPPEPTPVPPTPVPPTPVPPVPPPEPTPVPPVPPVPPTPDPSIADLQKQLAEQAEAMKLLAQRPGGQDAQPTPAKLPKPGDVEALQARIELELKDSPDLDYHWINPDPIEAPEHTIAGRPGGPTLI